MADKEELKIKKGSPEEAVKKKFIDTNPLFKIEKKFKKHLKEKLEKKKKKDMNKGGMTDLSGDGKITKKDVLIGRGVIKKKAGGKVKGYAPGGKVKKMNKCRMDGIAIRGKTRAKQRRS
jgi:hypothetical protein